MRIGHSTKAFAIILAVILLDASQLAAQSCVSDQDCPPGPDLCNPNECIEGECMIVELTCDDGISCTIDGCDPAVGCVFPEMDCDDGDPCTNDGCVEGRCNHERVCTPTPTATPTATETSTPTLTPTAPKLQDGSECDDPDDCNSGNCVDDVCCDTVCDGPNQICDLPTQEGICTALEAAPAPAASNRALALEVAILAGIGVLALMRRRTVNNLRGFSRP